ncbi:zinc-dependent alcohol dehydrogenase family protein [Actinomycetospora sp. TBRC 11914]|uniref:zinc-dependent alcohol dehydrogenase family protein n=1 Tax=Actinomycetospora sp. TBRC 11914 TaxID=2729387 RepID=UPI00145F7897|nr:zinc-dependent alcohol dehydrogenase family protein [Actinomycetospora sp. TBRC 11914]NMO93877.1 zinc-dependent alcohol dehydrogenase family protein [Actinomycetospora sp. TBRC 11914]
MKSVQFTEYGNRESITLVDVDPPAVGPTQVRVAVEAAPINPSDLLMLAGHYPVHPTLPSPAGAEGVGVVVETGSAVAGVHVGDRVLILPSWTPGTWQESVVVDERHALAVPGDVDPAQLATVGINAATAVLLLRYGAGLPEGSWVAQTAANSGLGAFVRGLAERAGFRVLDVVRSADAAASLRAAGAHHVVVSDETLADQLREVLGDERVALLLDGVGGDVVPALAPFLAREGDIVSFATLSGVPVAVPIRYLIFGNLHVHGFWLNNWLSTAPREEITALYDEVVGLVADGALSVPIEATYPLDEVDKALEHARHYGRSGKILFVARP